VNSNEYNSQIEFADNQDITRWALSYRGINAANKDFAFAKITEDGSWEQLMVLHYNTGNISIGSKTDNGAKLQVNGSGVFQRIINIYEENTKARLNHYMYDGKGRVYAYNEEANEFCDLWLGDNSGTALVVKDNGNVIIGTPNDNGSKLQVNGAMEATELVIPTAPPTNPQPGKHYLYLA
jgi:hypothetical protein